MCEEAGVVGSGLEQVKGGTSPDRIIDAVLVASVWHAHPHSWHPVLMNPEYVEDERVCKYEDEGSGY